jgi:hypothetical protein
VIDATTNETLGVSVYRDPEIHWDARRIVFAAKTEPAGATSVYEIGLDGRGLRRLTRSEKFADYQPAYLPDDRIVLLSTRPRALVPCNNTGVGTLHTMNRDGSDLRSISVNNVNEFDPAILPDGRILYGRWEYVDKTALYMQSLWTVSPDGRGEEALFKNNLARPTALLGARPVPGEPLVVAALTPHNGQAVGAIATIQPRKGKDNLRKADRGGGTWAASVATAATRTWRDGSTWWAPTTDARPPSIRAANWSPRRIARPARPPGPAHWWLASIPRHRPASRCRGASPA